jgi:hypothetical protein
MQKSQIYALIASGIVLLTIGLGRAIGQVDIGEAIPIAIQSFPSQIGPWRVVQKVPPYDDLQEVLPTAQVNEAIYSDASGRSVDFMLLTASRYGEIHDPANCFSWQGWTETGSRQLEVGDQRINEMQVQMQGRQAEVLYWLPDYYHVPTPRSAVGRAILRAYEARRPGLLGQSLLVRIMASNTPEGRQAALDFAQTAEGPLSRLPLQGE